MLWILNFSLWFKLNLELYKYLILLCIAIGFREEDGTREIPMDNLL